MRTADERRVAEALLLPRPSLERHVARHRGGLVADQQKVLPEPATRRELHRMHLGEFHGSGGAVLYPTETTPPPTRRDMLRALRIDEPPRFLAIEPAKAA